MLSDLVAEVAFDFEHQAADPALWIVRLEGEDLLGEGIHAAAGLAGADGAEDGDAGEEPPPGIVSQRGFLNRYRFLRLV